MSDDYCLGAENNLFATTSATVKVEKRMQACLDNIIVKTRAKSHINNFTTHFKLRSSINKQISYYVDHFMV